jgi:allantoicase
VFTHLRVTIFPDGGIKRVRVMGIRTDTGSAESFPVLPPAVASCPPLCTPQKETCIDQQHPVIRALPLSHEAFSAFGSVIQAYADANAAPPQVVVTGANQGTAVKFNHVLAKVQASFPKASPEIQAANFAVYRAQPIPSGPIFTVKLLERHPCNNQAFFVIGNGPKLWEDDLNQTSNGYLVVVAKNGEDDKPDLASLKAFVASSSQGVLYNPGTWHHPLIALKEVRCFLQTSWIRLKL